MNRSLLIAGLLLCSLALPVTAKTPAADQSLKPGRYTAHVKLLACEGCGPAVEQALKGLPAIETASVTAEKSQVDFTVKKGATLKVAQLQNALKAAAKKMGMGDYTLSKIQSLEPATPRP